MKHLHNSDPSRKTGNHKLRKVVGTAAAALALAACTPQGSGKEAAPKPIPSAVETAPPSPTPSSTAEKGVSIQPLLEAEAQLKPIEPTRLTSFISRIKQKGEVLDWSKGSRYRVVAANNGVVFTAELDFGLKPPTTPQEVAAAKPEFIQIYARFPGEKRAQHAFIDGSIPGDGGEGESLRPDGRVNELFGYGPELPKDFDFSDSEALLNNRVAQIQQSGTEAQALYASAVDAVLNQ